MLCSMRLSPNFSLAELERSQTALRLGLDNRAPQEAVERLALLCTEVLQPIRDHFGAVHISSGYRGPALNARIGGSRRSQHVRGEAADIVIAGVTPIEVCRWIEGAAIDFDQLIYEGAWTHVSYSPQHRRQVLTAHFDSGVRYSSGLIA